MALKKREETKYIVIHCSASRPSMDIGAKEIGEWHRKRGFLQIGYHFVIRRNGAVEVGRPIDTYGAHVRSHNHHSIGICLVGGVEENKPRKAENNFTECQWEALEKLILELHKRKYPEASVTGHRDFPGVNKDCPSFDTTEWYTKTFTSENTLESNNERNSETS